MAKKQTCTSCGLDKPLGEYYISSSPFHKNTGRISVCKNCLWDYVGADDEDIDLNKVADALRMIDKPFLVDLWQSSLQETEKNNRSTFKNYMKNLGLKDYRTLNWDDSDFEGFVETPYMSQSDFDVPFEIDEDVIQYWGRNYEDWEYEFLENERTKLMASFECPDYGMEMLMKEICFVNLDIEKLRRERDPKNQKMITSLIETRSKLMNDANMKPIQATGAEANDQVTFGTLIKKWENERPIPPPLDNEMKEYIDTFMVGHLAKMEGYENELTKKYEAALSKYTISFEETRRNNNDEFED